MKHLITLAFILLTVLGYSQTKDTDTISKENPDIEFLEKLIFEEINNYRASKGLNSFEWNNAIAGWAKEQSEWMNKVKKVGHRIGGPSGECCFGGGHAFGIETYRFHAIGYTQEWIESPPHRDILLFESPLYGGVGVKVEDNSYNGIYVTFLKN